MAYSGSISRDISYPPESLRGFDLSMYEWIDNLKFTVDPHDHLENAAEYVAVARELFLKAGWAGDGRIELMWIPPFMFSGVRTIEFTVGVIVWHVKQDSDGLSWLLSPVKLPFYSEFVPDESLRLYPHAAAGNTEDYSFLFRNETFEEEYDVTIGIYEGVQELKNSFTIKASIADRLRFIGMAYGMHHLASFNRELSSSYNARQCKELSSELKFVLSVITDPLLEKTIHGILAIAEQVIAADNDKEVLRVRAF